MYPFHFLLRINFIIKLVSPETWAFLPKYYDIVLHDNTAKMNWYKMTLSLFVSIDDDFNSQTWYLIYTVYLPYHRKCKK